jgi:hypothetical protein
VTGSWSIDISFVMMLVVFNPLARPVKVMGAADDERVPDTLITF